MTQVVIASMGRRHGPLDAHTLHYDVQHQLRNPAADPALRHATGLDAAVRQHVLDTPGAHTVLTAIVRDVLACLPVADAHHRLVTVGVHCAGGRHRSVALAEEAAARLAWVGVEVEVEHRDIGQPVLPAER